MTCTLLFLQGTSYLCRRPGDSYDLRPGLSHLLWAPLALTVNSTWLTIFKVIPKVLHVPGPSQSPEASCMADRVLG